MKNIFKYIISFALLSFAAMSCVPQAEIHEPGEKDVDGCYGVYFPVQQTDLAIDPTAPTTATIQVARTNSLGSITVPITVIDTSGIFSYTTVTFDDGQSETEFTLNFNDAAIGVRYLCSFVVEDPLYRSLYSTNPIALDFKVIRERWVELGMGSMIDATAVLWAPFKADVMILQNDNNPNAFRLMVHGYEDEHGEPYGIYTDETGVGDDYIEFYVVEKKKPFAEQGLPVADMWNIDEFENPDLVYFKYFDTGIYVSAYNSKVYYCHPLDRWTDTIEERCAYSKVISYQEKENEDDPDLPAVINISPYFWLRDSGMGADITNEEEVITIVFPGVVLADYTLEAEVGFSDNGNAPVSFEKGADIDTVRFTVHTGALNSAQVSRFAKEIVDTVATNVVATVEDEVTIQCDTTGIFTLVAVGYDSEGVAQSNTSAVFKYVAAGDTVKVVANVGMVATGKYFRLGTSDSVAEYYVYGTDIEEAKIVVCAKESYDADTTKVVQTLLASESLSADEIEAINGDGLVKTVYPLLPGTEYILLVWLSNGYETSIYQTTAKTTGKALGLELEDMLGIYAASGADGDGQPLPEPELFAIEESDDEDYDIMFTAFGNKRCDFPIYATLDFNEYTITIEDWQRVAEFVDDDLALYFGTNSNDGEPLVLSITGKGEFGNPSIIFGFCVADYAGNYLDWYAAYSDISANKVSTLTFEEFLASQGEGDEGEGDEGEGGSTPDFLKSLKSKKFDVKPGNKYNKELKTKPRYKHLRLETVPEKGETVKVKIVPAKSKLNTKSASTKTKAVLKQSSKALFFSATNVK